MDNVYPIKDSNTSAVAELMAEIKPEWWDFKGTKDLPVLNPMAESILIAL